MISHLSARTSYTFLIAGSVGIGVLGFLLLCMLAGTQLPIQHSYGILSISTVVGIFSIILWISSRRTDHSLSRGAVAISILTATGTVMALSSAYQLVNYISLPVDLLSFSESPFLNDIVKLRRGVPIYTPLPDNNSYPYTPGTQVLTYLISTLFGHADSIPVYRVVQFSYVILASILATKVCDLLAGRFLSSVEYRHRLVWISVWLPMFFLLTTEPRFNEYTHSLHNDGLALLVSVFGYWLIVRHSIAPRLWMLGLMTVLPAVGFLVKQNQLAWIGIFLVYLLAAGNVPRRQTVFFLIGSVGFVVATIWSCYLLWGDPFLDWVFVVLGKKGVSPLRSFLHLLQAGGYAIMGLFGGWMLVFRNGSRTATGLWICWLLLFGIEAYTSGLGWHANHLGPGIVISACWFFAAVVRVWPKAENARSSGEHRVQQAVAVCAMILLPGALGLVVEPRNPVPPDFFRYVADIEKEFHGFAPEKVLMDTGTWVYLRENVVMKDRSTSASIWVGKNQKIDHALLGETIQRIEKKTYDKILARQLDTELSWYDFQDRGSGVKKAILSNYREVRRIPGVEGIERWWPRHLVSDIVVLLPNRGKDVLSLSSPTQSLAKHSR